MLMDIIKARHSIRKYTDKQISREELEVILEAENYAPNAGGGQRSMMVAVHNADLAAKIGRMNLAKFDRSKLLGGYVSKEQPSSIDDPTIGNTAQRLCGIALEHSRRLFLYGHRTSLFCILSCFGVIPRHFL